MSCIDQRGKLAVYVRDIRFVSGPKLDTLMEELEKSGFCLYRVHSEADLVPGTEMLLSIGGDGTFLSAASVVGDSGIPVLGVNFGRLGFLSENMADAVPLALLGRRFSVEDRTLLHADVEPLSSGGFAWPYALNEFTVHRLGASTLGVTVRIDGNLLPVYWSDGLIVATSSGSTAYSLSVGGPIVLPDSKVLIIAPISPHNLNVRPLVVPDSSVIEIGFVSRDASVVFSADNRNTELPASSSIRIAKAGFCLKRVRLDDSNFINALTGKLFWGEDIRNGTINDELYGSKR